MAPCYDRDMAQLRLALLLIKGGDAFAGRRGFACEALGRFTFAVRWLDDRLFGHLLERMADAIEDRFYG
jgi:hypothetical protein